MRRLTLLTLLLALQTPEAAAQENGALRRGREAYGALDYRTAIASVRRALGQQLTASEVVESYELLGFMYSALDSNTQAVDAFRNLIILDPEREPDPRSVSPQITSLYA